MCFWERQAVCWHWASPRKNRSSCWRFVRPSSPPPSLHPSIRCNWSQLCVCVWFVLVCVWCVCVCVCVCVWYLFREHVKCAEETPHRYITHLCCMMLSLSCGVGGFYWATRCFKFPGQHTKSKWYTTNERRLSLNQNMWYFYIKLSLCVQWYIIVKYHIIILQ